ncbi:MAG: nucleotidyltransferase family protein [Nitrososphaerales archaeon]
MLKKSSGSVRIYYPKLSKDELISILKERVKDLSKELPIRFVVLFGSYAKNRYTAASDVDLFIVVTSGDKGELYKKIMKA